MKSKLFLISSLLLFFYLLTVGGHFVAARWWAIFKPEIPWYLRWWDGQFDSLQRITVWFFLPSLLYSWMQFRFLKSAGRYE